MFKRAVIVLGCCLALTLGFIYAEKAADPEKIDSDVNWRIRQEGTENSQVMRTLHYLTDVYGPRLTGSPNWKSAGEWAIRQMKEWGMTHGQLEPWEWGHPGWQNERLSAHIVAPIKDSLVCEVVAWTPGTNGPVRGEVVQIEPPSEPTEEEFAKYLETLKAKVRGKIVFVGKHRVVPVTFNPTPKRREDSEVRAQFDAQRTPGRRPTRTPGRWR